MTRRGPAVAPVSAFRGRGGEPAPPEPLRTKSGRVGGTKTSAVTGDFGLEERKQEKTRVSCRHTQTHIRPQCGRFGAFGSVSAEAEITNDCVRMQKRPSVSGLFGVSEANSEEV